MRKSLSVLALLAVSLAGRAETREPDQIVDRASRAAAAYVEKISDVTCT